MSPQGQSELPSAILPRLLAGRLIRAQGSAPRVPPPGAGDLLPGLSVVMAAHNEEGMIEGCLAQLEGLADEIVVVDAASSDRTVEIARGFTERIIPTTNKPMLEINKNIAMEAASHRWVLVLDPDERLSGRLKEQIRAVVEADDQRLAGYWTPRRNYILGQWFRTMGMYPGSQLRLVRKGEGRFSEQEHHLAMALTGAVGYLSGDLIHLSDSHISEILEKRTRYAEFAALQMYERGVPFSLRRMVSEPIRSFLRQYLLLGGFMEGSRGFIYAALSAYGGLLRHARLWELRRGGKASGFR